MFTRLKKGRWNYMLLAAIASIALAALTSLLIPRAPEPADPIVSHDNDQIVTGRHLQYNQSAVTFVN